MPETEEQYLDDEIATPGRGLATAKEMVTTEYHKHLWRIGVHEDQKDGTRLARVFADLNAVPPDFLRLVIDMAREGLIEGGFCLSFAVNKPIFDYQAYLQSDEWKSRRDAARERAGGRCQTCNADGPILDTHHRTYERIGEELPADLTVLCRGCHDAFHEHRKLARPQ